MQHECSCPTVMWLVAMRSRTGCEGSTMGCHDLYNGVQIPEDISYFANPYCTMEVSDENTLTLRYRFKDFRGTIEVPAGWDARLEQGAEA